MPESNGAVFFRLVIKGCVFNPASPKFLFFFLIFSFIRACFFSFNFDDNSPPSQHYVIYVSVRVFLKTN